MNRYVFILSLVIISILAGYFVREDGRIRINGDSASIFFLRGGYRSWSIEYSHGLLLSDPPRRLWHFPTFRHVDVRKWLENNPQIEVVK